ncbi:sigma-70 family RNA polymerase sigma factor [Planctomycetaceae bacterium AH-315-I19]|nr:sigma-70 family RNA polymerase sigma factor [Planctomycetaceae bacterium AH-315-I19]
MNTSTPDKNTRDEQPAELPSRGSARELTARIAKGDDAALTQLYERWFDRMVGMAMAGTSRDESFCMDAAQDAFVRLIRNPVVLDDDRALAAWLKKLVMSSAYDRLKSERRRADREASRGEIAQVGPPASTARLPEVEQAIAQLEAEQGEIVLARYRFGWTLARIGERFNLATGAVDGRLGRIVRTLRKSLNDGSER